MTNEISQQLNGMALVDMTCSRVWAILVSVRAPCFSYTDELVGGWALPGFNIHQTSRRRNDDL
jgi:hypothetical protein